MKKFVLALMAMLTIQLSASAMSYEQARDQALFLTDKMAYELNLTEDQYEAAYEINLDYLMRVNTVDDLYGVYWTRRNLDLSYIMLDWQYNLYCSANYFYRPLWWDAGYWHFGIYARYPHRNYFYFGCPNFVYVYRGGHSWYNNGGHSWYNGRHFGRGSERDGRYFGMRDGFRRGDYREGFGNGRRLDTTIRNNNNRTMGPASDRNITTGSRGFGNGSRSSAVMGSRNQSANSSISGRMSTPNRNLERIAPSTSNSADARINNPQIQNRMTRSSSTRTTVRNYNGDNYTTSRIGSTPNRSFTPNSSTRSSMRMSSPSSSSMQSRSYSSPSRSFNGSGSNFGGGSRSSFGGGSRSSFGGGSSSMRSSGGSHSFGGHR